MSVPIWFSHTEWYVESSGEKLKDEILTTTEKEHRKMGKERWNTAFGGVRATYLYTRCRKIEAVELTFHFHISHRRKVAKHWSAGNCN